MTEETVDKTIKQLKPCVWRRFKAFAASKDKKLADALEELLTGKDTTK